MDVEMRPDSRVHRVDTKLVAPRTRSVLGPQISDTRFPVHAGLPLQPDVFLEMAAVEVLNIQGKAGTKSQSGRWTTYLKK